MNYLEIFQPLPMVCCFIITQQGKGNSELKMPQEELRDAITYCITAQGESSHPALSPLVWKQD